MQTRVLKPQQSQTSVSSYSCSTGHLSAQGDYVAHVGAGMPSSAHFWTFISCLDWLHCWSELVKFMVPLLSSKRTEQQQPGELRHPSWGQGLSLGSLWEPPDVALIWASTSCCEGFSMRKFPLWNSKYEQCPSAEASFSSRDLRSLAHLPPTELWSLEVSLYTRVPVPTFAPSLISGPIPSLSEGLILPPNGNFASTFSASLQWSWRVE